MPIIYEAVSESLRSGAAGAGAGASPGALFAGVSVLRRCELDRGPSLPTLIDARSSAIVTCGICVPGGASLYFSARLRTSFEKCRPHALHNVRAPSGPRRHSGVSLFPHEWHTPGAGARLRFRYLGTYGSVWSPLCLAGEACVYGIEYMASTRAG